ncbi:MAG: hypothetical protein QF570_08230 [Myxococcota bacterium]|nr:hypothetical protein [Myxococcota bacterium]
MVVALVLLAAGPALAQSMADDSDPWRGSDDESRETFGVRGGIGFMEGPDAFVAAFEIETMVTRQVGVGVGTQFGVQDEFIVLSPTVHSRYRFDVSHLENRYLRKLRPFAQAGFGITHLDVDERGGGDKDATDLMFNFGGGFDYPIDEHAELGSRIMINVIPGEVLDQRIYFSWELITVRYRW